MKNYKLLIQYDGTNYAGWQIQKNSITVQQKITDALEVLTKEKINLVGSGRTDTGVHAFGQVANFRTENEIDIYRFKHSLNSILPFDISILKMNEIDVDFHSRFDAKKRTYIYMISKTKSPFYKNYSYFYHNKIDVNKLNDLSKTFLGEKDFTSFSKKVSEQENRTCSIYSARWKTIGELTYFIISANRYLHGMVRAITGTLLKVQELNYSESHIEEMFKSLNREVAFDSVPPNGLFLYKVEY